MNFGQALELLKQGAKVAREGWNGKDMWLCMMPGLELPPYSSQDAGAKVNDRTARFIGEDTPLCCNPYIVMWTADGKWQPGWLASQTDMLAEDWIIVAQGDGTVIPSPPLEPSAPADEVSELRKRVRTLEINLLKAEKLTAMAFQAVPGFVFNLFDPAVRVELREYLLGQGVSVEEMDALNI